MSRALGIVGSFDSGDLTCHLQANPNHSKQLSPLYLHLQFLLKSCRNTDKMGGGGGKVPGVYVNLNQTRHPNGRPYLQGITPFRHAIARRRLC